MSEPTARRPGDPGSQGGGHDELDDRPRSLGPGRVLIAVYAVFALAATARATVQLVRDAGEAPLAYGLSALAAVVYVVATLALAHNGPRARTIAWITCTFELVGVLVVGTVSLLAPEAFPRATVWSTFGIGYGFVPLVLPIAGLVYLARSRPGRAAG
jgi:hypothetical protein